MKQNTQIRVWVIAALMPLIGGMAAYASPQDEQPPLEGFQVEDTADNPPVVALQDDQDPVDQAEPANIDQQIDNQDIPEDLPGIADDELNVRPQPIVRVDKRLAGWQLAGLGTDSGRISNQLAANWVMLNQNEGLDGRLIGVSEPVTVSLLRGGFLVSQVTTDEFGVFRFESASPGTYTIVGNSYDTFFVFGFLAVERADQAVNMPLMIEPLPAIGIENIRLISKLIRQYSSSVRFDPYGIWDIGEASDDPPEFFGWNGLKYLTQDAIPSPPISHRAVAILGDGRMIGRIHQSNNRTGRPVEVRNTEIKIIQDGELIAETQTDVLGVFEVVGLSPGDYALVAVGVDGIAAIGLELVDGGFWQPSQARNGYDPLYRSVSYSPDNSPPVFDALLADPEATGWINAYVQEQEYERAMNEPRPELADQMPYDYFSYPGGGGGAGGGELGSGLADLLLLGVFGVAIADSARSETFFGGGIPVVSPFFP